MVLITFAAVELIAVVLILVCSAAQEPDHEGGARRESVRSGSRYATTLRRHRIGALSIS